MHKEKQILKKTLTSTTHSYCLQRKTENSKLFSEKSIYFRLLWEPGNNGDDIYAGESCLKKKAFHLYLDPRESI